MILLPPSNGYPSQPTTENGVRLYAIGDIHGRLDLLTALHDQIRDDATHATANRFIVIYVGDYIDRGAESRAVIDYLANEPLDGFEQVCLKGNHEEMMLGFLRNPETHLAWLSTIAGGKMTLQSYGIDTETGKPAQWCQRLHQALPDHHCAFLENLQSFYSHGDYYFCHAGIRPGIALDLQKDSDLFWIREDFLDSIEDHGKIIIHGHTISPRPDIHHNRIGIDTGAYKSNVLTCMVASGTARTFLSTESN